MTAPLDGLRVLEFCDQRGEFAGKLLAALGADVVKVELPHGSPTRAIGPFLDDLPGPERSLFFWHYNEGKRSLTLDLDSANGRDYALALIRSADVVLESLPGHWIADQAPGALTTTPTLIWCAISDFGKDGPWAGYQASDLLHLALGGQMMVSGYPADDEGRFDAPPIAPQMWHAYHMGGLAAVMNLMAALSYRDTCGLGQFIDLSIHEACANQTEIHLSYFLAAGVCLDRQSQFAKSVARDGTHMVTMVAGFGDPVHRILEWAEDAGLTHDLTAEEYDDPAHLRSRPGRARIDELISRLVATGTAGEIFAEAQARGLTWAPIRLPHENLQDAHFQFRHTFAHVQPPEAPGAYWNSGAAWLSDTMPWLSGRPSPRLGEHNAAVGREWLDSALREPN